MTPDILAHPTSPLHRTQESYAVLQSIDISEHKLKKIQDLFTGLANASFAVLALTVSITFVSAIAILPIPAGIALIALSALVAVACIVVSLAIRHKIQKSHLNPPQTLQLDFLNQTLLLTHKKPAENAFIQMDDNLKIPLSKENLTECLTDMPAKEKTAIVENIYSLSTPESIGLVPTKGTDHRCYFEVGPKFLDVSHQYKDSIERVWKLSYQLALSSINYVQPMLGSVKFVFSCDNEGR